MRLSLVCAVIASALSISTVAAADSAPAPGPLAVKAGQWIYSTDGSVVGRIDYVEREKDGTAKSAGVIRDMKMVYIPVNTLSTGQKGFVTTLTKGDVNKLR